MKIKEFNFDLELDKEGQILGISLMKKLELKLFAAIYKESKTFSQDFRDFEKLFAEDPERDRLLTMLVYRGWRFIYENSPLFNIPGEAERLRNELLNEDV